MNKRKEGYTFISTVVILSLIVIVACYILKDTDSLINIYKNEEDHIQSSYYAESVINIILSEKYEEDLNSSLEKLCFYGKNDVEFCIYDNIDNNLENKVNIVKKNVDFDAFSIEVISDYKGIKTQAKANGNYINDVYKDKKAIINKNTVDYDEYIMLEQEFCNLKEYCRKIDDYIILDSDTYYIGKNKKVYEIYSVKNNEKVTVKRFYPENYVYINQDGGNLIIADDINLRGILDAENLCLLENANLEGVLNLRSSILTDDKNLNVQGIIFNLSESGENNLRVKHDLDQVYYLGRFLPRFIKPRIYSINKL